MRVLVYVYIYSIIYFYIGRFIPGEWSRHSALIDQFYGFF